MLAAKETSLEMSQYISSLEDRHKKLANPEALTVDPQFPMLCRMLISIYFLHSKARKKQLKEYMF